MASDVQVRGAYNGGEMSFEEIATTLGISHQGAMKLYRSGLRKIASRPSAISVLRYLAREGPIIGILRDLARDPETLAELRELAVYHFELRGRSAECQAV